MKTATYNDKLKFDGIACCFVLEKYENECMAWAWHIQTECRQMSFVHVMGAFNWYYQFSQRKWIFLVARSPVFTSRQPACCHATTFNLHFGYEERCGLLTSPCIWRNCSCNRNIFVSACVTSFRFALFDDLRFSKFFFSWSSIKRNVDIRVNSTSRRVLC